MTLNNSSIYMQSSNGIEVMAHTRLAFVLCT